MPFVGLLGCDPWAEMISARDVAEKDLMDLTILYLSQLTKVVGESLKVVKQSWDGALLKMPLLCA